MGKIIRIDSLHFGNRKSCSANGNGVRICVWFLGCDINCDGCHNKDYWDFDNPNFEDFSDKHIEMIIDEMSEYSDIYSGISILGGEPFAVQNIKDVIKLCERYKSEFSEKNIWIWSGYTLEHLREQEGEYGDNVRHLLELCDYIVDGPFILEKRNIALKFRGSNNQRITNLKTGEEIK